MAPHDTDTRREARRHAVPLIVLAICLALVLVGFVWWLGYVFVDSRQTPVTEPAQSEQPASY